MNTRTLVWILVVGAAAGQTDAQTQRAATPDVPNTTILQPRDATVLAPKTTETASASKGRTDPQTPIQGTASRLSTDSLARDAELAEDIQLICQGGAKPAVGPFYRADADGAEQQMMYFAPAENPARADGSGLVPTRCSFLDRSVADGGVHIVLFKATTAEGEAMSKSLTSPDTYWRFIVRKNETGSYKDETGYYEATSHAQWSPEPSSNVAPSGKIAGTSRLVENPTGVAGSLDAKLIEIRCRGGFAPRSFDKPASLQKPGAAILRLNFNRNTKQPDARGSGLQERSCAPSDQSWSWEQIPFSPSGYSAYMVFETAASSPEQLVKRSRHGSPLPTAADYPDERNIPEYLADPNHYWRFFITKGDGRSTLFASRHERWLPAAHVSASAQIAGKATDKIGARQFRLVKPGPTPTQRIQGAAKETGADLKMDCVRNPPRIANIRGTFTPGERVVIAGMCFGSQMGQVHFLSGSIDNSTVRPAFSAWNETEIVLEMPASSAVRALGTQPIRYQVRRADGRLSDPKHAEFVGEPIRLPVSADLWRPSYRYDEPFHVTRHTESEGLIHPFAESLSEEATHTREFRVAVNPRCRLDGVDVIAEQARVRSINGWTGPIAHQDSVTVTWSRVCRMITSRAPLEQIQSHECGAAFRLEAQAICPRGISVRP
jgi:hypothetical protein